MAVLELERRTAVDDYELNESGNGASEGALRFESLDTGDEVLVYAHAIGEGNVSLVVSHEMDGELEVVMGTETTEQLALRLARAADAAREKEQ